MNILELGRYAESDRIRHTINHPSTSINNTPQNVTPCHAMPAMPCLWLGEPSRGERARVWRKDMHRIPPKHALTPLAIQKTPLFLKLGLVVPTFFFTIALPWTTHTYFGKTLGTAHETILE